jgi:hypothetical protein
MNSRTELDLLRLLRGDLPAAEARALRDRLAREPGLAAAYERLAAVWGTLEPPVPAPVPPGFTGRVMARVRDEAGGARSWAQAPGWVRAAAAASLLAGAALGAGLGAGLGLGPATPAAPPAPSAIIVAVPSPRGGLPLPPPVATPSVGPTAAAAPVPPASTPAPPVVAEGATELGPGDREMEEVEEFEEAGPAGEDAFDEPGAASLAEGYWAAFGDDAGGDRGETLP